MAATYEISLSDEEVRTLAWLADRGYWPTAAYDAMALRDDQPEECERGIERVWEIPEPAAWSIPEFHRDDPDAFLSCAGPELSAKCVKLWQSIV